MTNLKTANVEKCMSLLNEFYDAVTVDESKPDLLIKKQEAGKALGHLGMLFNAAPHTPEDDTGEKACTKCGDEVQS